MIVLADMDAIHQGRYQDKSKGGVPGQGGYHLIKVHSPTGGTIDSNGDPRQGAPDFLEIAQKNFELFSKKVAESGVMTTNSSVSQRDEMMRDMMRQSGPTSSKSVRELTSDHIEVINIS